MNEEITRLAEAAKETAELLKMRGVCRIGSAADGVPLVQLTRELWERMFPGEETRQDGLRFGIYVDGVFFYYFDVRA